MPKDEIEDALNRARNDFPQELKWLIDNNRKRLSWQIGVVLDRLPRGAELVDIGGGIVPFMSICQELGYVTTIVDDFADFTYKSNAAQQVIESIENQGVRIVSTDALKTRIAPVTDGGFSLVTTHDSMEHWHNSPKQMFRRFWEDIHPGGLFWLGVPNCVNLRKRITVPFGHGKWSRMADWYEPETFRGHVREPDVDDLRYIARDLGASKFDLIGKNWLGYRNSRKIVRSMTPFVDGILQLRPSLCSDIYVVAQK